MKTVESLRAEVAQISNDIDKLAKLIIGDTHILSKSALQKAMVIMVEDRQYVRQEMKDLIAEQEGK